MAGWCGYGSGGCVSWGWCDAHFVLAGFGIVVVIVACCVLPSLWRIFWWCSFCWLDFDHGFAGFVFSGCWVCMVIVYYAGVGVLWGGMLYVWFWWFCGGGLSCQVWWLVLIARVLLVTGSLCSI